MRTQISFTMVDYVCRYDGMFGERDEVSELQYKDDDNTAVLRENQPQSLRKIRHQVRILYIKSLNTYYIK